MTTSEEKSCSPVSDTLADNGCDAGDDLPSQQPPDIVPMEYQQSGERKAMEQRQAEAALDEHLQQLEVNDAGTPQPEEHQLPNDMEGEGPSQEPPLINEMAQLRQPLDQETRDDDKNQQDQLLEQKPNNKGKALRVRSKERKALAKRILAKFNCPFWMEEGECFFNLNTERCFFAHPPRFEYNQEDSDDDKEKRETRNLPYYCCVYYLLNKCKHKGGECEMGLHLDIFDLENLEHYEETNKEKVKNFFGEEGTRYQCGICYDYVFKQVLPRNRLVCVQEKCIHTYCLECSLTVRSGEDSKTNCPFCRTASKHALFAYKIFPNDDEKKAFFRKHLPHIDDEETDLDADNDSVAESVLAFYILNRSHTRHRVVNNAPAIDDSASDSTFEAMVEALDL